MNRDDWYDNPPERRGSRALGCITLIMGSLLLWAVVILLVGVLFGWWKV